MDSRDFILDTVINRAVRDIQGLEAVAMLNNGARGAAQDNAAATAARTFTAPQQETP